MTVMEYQYLIELLSDKHLEVTSRGEMEFIVTLKSKLRKEMNELKKVEVDN